MGIFELLVPSTTVLEAVGAGLLVHEIRPMLEKSGFTTLRRDGLLKVKSGLTTVEEVFFATAA
jgi:type II secretory ATPase GspE/PulE/Tfp pilus assembly ATPase PilB-like protein